MTVRMLLRCIGLLVCLSSVPAFGQSDPVPGLLAPLADPNVQVRSAGFYSLMSAAPATPGPDGGDQITLGVSGLLSKYTNDAPQIIAALNQLLITENGDTKLGDLSGGPNDETPGDFYGDVVEAVVSVKSPSSIPSLVGAIDTGGMVTTALASYGKASLPYVLPLLYSSDDEKREAAAYTLIQMLHPQYAITVNDHVSQSQIRAGLRLVITWVSPPTSEFKNLAATYKNAIDAMPSVPAGDLDGDGVVNCTDLALVKASFGKRVGQAGFDIRADVNGDGVVDSLDLNAETKLLPAGTTCR